MKKNIKYLLIIFLLLTAYCLLLPIRGFCANKMWWATCLTGGTSGCLDAIDGDNLTDGDAAFVIRDNSGTYEAYIYRLEDTAVGESSPDVISPDTNAGNKRWRLTKIFSSNLSLPNIITFPSAAPTSGVSSIMQTTDAGASSWLESTANCIAGGSSAGTSFECKATSDVWELMWTQAITATASNNQLVCFDDNAETNYKFKACGAPQTDNSTASHAIYKDSDGHIEDQVLTIDAHAASTTITLIPGICPIIHNASQADSNINNTLPAVGAGKCFVALATSAETDKYWRLTAAAANTICLNRTCGKDYIQFDTPAVGDTFTCMSDGTNWYCYDRDSDATAGDL